MHLVKSTLVVTWILSTSRSVLAQTNIEGILKKSDRYNAEKITQVQQLQDISSLDWSYEALRNLAKKYGCVEGFPDKPDGMALLQTYQVEYLMHPMARSLKQSLALAIAKI